MQAINGIYVSNLEDVVNGVESQLANGFSLAFNELRDGVRGVLERVHGVPRGVPLIVYGEQADPPIVKNIGKSFFASIALAQLQSRGIAATKGYLPLFNDIFGSNAEVFTRNGLLTPSQVGQLGRQTYAFAPTPFGYASKLMDFIQRDHPDRARQLLASGISFEVLSEMERTKSIGEFNVGLRGLLEKSAGLDSPPLSFSPVEDQIIRNPELLAKLLLFSETTGSKSPLYVTWKSLEPGYSPPNHPEQKSLESGYRRCRVFLDGANAILRDMQTNNFVLNASFASLLEDGRAQQFALNAGSRAAMVYAMSIPGVYITGGGSTYNDGVIARWRELGYPLPIMAHIQNPVFVEKSSRLAWDLPSKSQDIMETIANANLVKTTSAGVFAHFASWRMP